MERFSLEGVNGNAHAIMGYVSEAMRKVGLKKDINAYLENAQSGDYGHLIRVSIKMLDKCNEC